MNELDDRLNLRPLDPASADPGFWIRYHRGVMARAEEELSRRRLAGVWTFSDVVFQWRKALVPMTLLAASLAGIVVWGEGGVQTASPLEPMALEEALVVGLEGEPIPAFLERTAELDEVAFLAEAGGFRP